MRIAPIALIVVALTHIRCEPTEPATAPTTGPSASRPADSPAVATHVERARRLLTLHRIRPALDEIDAALAVDARHKDARMIRAYILTKLARPDEAATILESLADEFPDDLEIRQRFAAVRYDQGRHAESVTLFESLDGADHDWQTVSGLTYAEALLRVNRTDDAADTVARLLVEDPWRSDAYLLMAQIDTRRGRGESADVWLKRYQASAADEAEEQKALRLEYDGNEAGARFVRGQLALKHGRLHAAMLQYNAAIRANPGYGPAYLALADLSVRLERPNDAIVALRRLPAAAEVHAALGDIYLASEEFDRAVESLTEALRMQPDHAEWSHRLQAARDAAASGAPNDPLAAGRRRIRARMADEPLSAALADLAELAALYVLHGRIDRARELVLFAAQLAPSNAEAQARVAPFFTRPDDAFVRLWACQRALRAAPHNATFQRAWQDACARLDVSPKATKP